MRLPIERPLAQSLVRPVAAALVLGLSAGYARAQAPPKPSPSEAQVQRMKEIYLPSEPHEWLARLDGVWRQEAEYGAGSGEVVTARGQVVNRVVLGGRFLHSEGTVEQADGPLKVAWLLLFGFDGRTREYTVIVLDSLGTYYVTARGRRAGSTVVMHGETADGAGTKKFEITLRWVDPDTYRTEIIFHIPGRTPVLAVAATHRRVTAGG